MSMRYLSHRLMTLAVLVAVTAVLSPAPAVQAQPPLLPADEPPEYAPGQLLVLLQHGAGAPAPEQLVESHRRGEPLPGNLGIGGPEAVRHLITSRARGTAREALLANPDSARARLQRYLVFNYPENANLEQILEALKRNPNVLHAHRSRVFQLSAVTPNDPLFPVQPMWQDYQWGLHALNMPAAWEYTKGHGYVGIIDTGLDVDHEELRPFDAVGNFVGGNFRDHLSHDFGDTFGTGCDQNAPELEDRICDDNVDEMEGTTTTTAGHGTHVSGIIAANSNNGVGVSGLCWNCSILMEKMVDDSKRFAFEPEVVNSFAQLLEYGAQVVNMSFGFIGTPRDCTNAQLDAFCLQLDEAEDREVASFAAAGNFLDDLQFPAGDPRTISVGGLEPSLNFWDFRDGDPRNCPFLPSLNECGSSWTQEPGTAMQDFVAPAVDVLSTFYVGATWNAGVGCADNTHPSPGYGLCTGTSMATPHGTGLGGLLRSVNPLLGKEQIRDVINDNADRAGNWDPQFGFGLPDAAASVEDTLGRAAGSVLDNRLTPLFQQFSDVAGDYAYTTVPQYASALTWEPEDYISPLSAPRVGGFGPFFPGGRTCQVGPCFYEPRADVYVFTTDRSPNGHPLVPLYRMSFDEAFGGNPDDRDHTYTTEAAGIEVFAGVGYRLDGVEGYIYERCTPEPSCIPAGAVRLYRLYNATRDDWAIFPESELASFQSQGYTSQACCNDWIGYVYENVDSDFDTVIDGFETLIGTNPADSDSDCDGVADGTEIVQYPYSDPLGAPGCSTSQVIGEVGQLTSLTHSPQTVSFSRSYANPVVIAQPPSYDGANESVVRITSVTSTGFTFYVHEAPDQDGPHTTEDVSWVVLEAGSWRLADGTELEVGKVVTNKSVGTNFAGSFQTVSFSQPFSVAPAALSQVQTNNDPWWVKTRQQLATTTSFRLALEEEEAATAFHGTETIGWVAIEPSTGTWSGRAYQSAVSANVVTDAFTTLSFGAGFSAAPRFMAAMATRNGGNNAGLRYRSLGSGSVQVKVEEDTTFDTEVAHISERVSFLAIQGNGTLEASPR